MKQVIKEMQNLSEATRRMSEAESFAVERIRIEASVDIISELSQEAQMEIVSRITNQC